MQVKPGGVTSRLQVTTEKKDGQDWTLADAFRLVPLLKHVPEALWGELDEEMKPDLNGRLIENVWSGCKIIPKKMPEPGDTDDINANDLQFNLETYDESYHWSQFNRFEREKEASNGRGDDTLFNELQAQLGLSSSDFELTGEQVMHDFIDIPHKGTLVST